MQLNIFVDILWILFSLIYFLFIRIYMGLKLEFDQNPLLIRLLLMPWILSIFYFHDLNNVLAIRIFSVVLASKLFIS